MGKVRKVILGDIDSEKEQRRRADARRETKKSKKMKVDGVGLKGGERTAVVEGTELKSEIRELIEKVEKGGEIPEKTAKKKKKPAGVKPRSKKYRDARTQVDRKKLYPLEEAIELVKKTSFSKFDGTVELHINLNPNAMNGKKDYRGTVTLPHGTGKQIRVVEANDALVSDISNGNINFDVLVAHPSMMPKLAKVARILGPKGLMPNPKTGTVTADVEKRIKELSQGQINFKTEPDNPIIHMSVGKVSFDGKKLLENINAGIQSIGKEKISKATVAATMGPGIKITLA